MLQAQATQPRIKYLQGEIWHHILLLYSEQPQVDINRILENGMKEKRDGSTCNWPGLIKMQEAIGSWGFCKIVARLLLTAARTLVQRQAQMGLNHNS